jgi:hypothetical protein
MFKELATIYVKPVKGDQFGLITKLINIIETYSDLSEEEWNKYCGYARVMHYTIDELRNDAAITASGKILNELVLLKRDYPYEAELKSRWQLACGYAFMMANRAS